MRRQLKPDREELGQKNGSGRKKVSFQFLLPFLPQSLPAGRGRGRACGEGYLGRSLRTLDWQTGETQVRKILRKSVFCCCLFGAEESFELKSLDLSLNDAGSIAEVLQKAPRLNKLETMNLKRCKISATSVSQLHGLLCNTNPNDRGLTSLILDGVKFSGTDALQSMLGDDVPMMHFTLSSLSLCGCSLTDKDVKPLMVALGKNLELTELNLSSNRLTDSTVNHLLESLTDKCSLITLNFSINKVLY